MSDWDTKQSNFMKYILAGDEEAAVALARTTLEEGATQAMISNKHRKLIKDVEYVELTTYENFQREFVEAMYLR